MSRNKEVPVPTLMKPSEASARFNIPLATIYFWHRVGNIHGVNLNGRCLRIFSKSLLEFLGSRASSESDSLPPAEIADSAK